ncbi:MAG TPA: FtsX-like permease family protein [Candidatus Saccharimonadales bacterium]|nr:FtsX-like permease family protein [Candidatus Saccharimonadales bacterium]
MRPVLRKTLADVRRHKLQTSIVGFVVFLSCLTSTLALTLLVETDAPFDHAFEQAQGAHLFVDFDSSQVSAAQVQATMSLPQVSAASGPWRVLPASILIQGGRVRDIPVAGRSDASGAVDRLSLDSGRWLQRDGEVVLSRQLADETGLGVGDTLEAASDSTFPALRVVGIAVEIGNGPAAWVEPSQLPAANLPDRPPAQFLVAYRLHQASTLADIASAIQAITNSMPATAVQDTSNYLDAKLNADRTTAVMIPFLLAFSVLALVASALIIANLISGAVIAGIREIGIMKSVGFTPAQVVVTFAGRTLLPAAVGCAIGLPGGVALSQPFLSDTAHAFGLPRTFGFAPGPDALGLSAILLVVVLATIFGSVRAGRLSAAAAIAAGSAPAGDGGSRQARAAGALPLPRAMTLGLGDSLTSPVRSAMTVVAIVIGVATVTFAAGIHLSLTLVASALTHDQQIQVQVYRAGETKKGGPSGPSDDQTTALIAGQPGTARFVGVGHANASVAGAGESVPVFAYRGDSSWLGFVLINGRWFNAPGEAVAPTAFFTRTGHKVGDTITADFYGTPVQFRLVGEIFDQQGDDILLRTSFESVPGNLVAWDYDVQLRPGTDVVAYATAIENTSPGLSARLNHENGVDTAFLLINSVLAGLAIVLGLIAASGVFNTVVLNTREKARDFAIMKAIGMTPRQVITMVLASVAVLGVIGAAIGVPAGVALHRYIVTVMGQIATSTGIPDVFFHVFGVQLLAGLGLAGIVIAMAGALLPARWAARSRIAEVLQAE